MKIFLSGAIAGLLLFFPLLLRAQVENEPAPHINSILNGQILDQRTKEPIEGATIQIKGITHSVLSDHKGRFSIKTGQTLPYTLIVSYVGYDTLETVAGKSPLTLYLQQSSNQLNDIVVVGYGTQRRKDLIGSISKIDPAETRTIPGGSFDQQLQGKAAGVQINAGSGIPGQDLFIRVRGTTSIYASNDPLYIIDGVFISSGTLEQTTSITASGRMTSPMADLNPADIENIEILKDASAVAIYGSRGANGVVIVTTKKGKYEQAPVVELNTQFGASWVPKSREWKTTTGPEHAMLVNEYNTSMGRPLPFRPVDSIINGEAGLGNPEDQPTYDRMAYLDHQGAPLYNLNLSVRGGSKDTRYYIGGGYDYEAAIWNPISFSRASLKFNLDQKISDKVSLSAYNTLSATPRNQGNAGDGANGTLIEASLNIPTYLPIYSETGEPLKWVNFDNITYLTNHLNIKSLSLHYIGNLALNIDVAPHLKLRSSWGADYNNFKLDQYWGANTNIGAPPINGYAQTSNSISSTFLNEQTLTYSNKIGLNSFGVLAGNTLQQSAIETVITSGTNFPNNSYTGISQAASQTAEQSRSKNRLTSLFSRINYNYGGRYYVEGTLRADGSSKFAKGHRWGYFPSVGIAWDLTSEKFIPTGSALSNLKISASYGVAGNQGGIGDFAAMGLWSSGVGYADTTGGAQQPGTSPYQLANPDLTWEKTTQTNIGIDLGLWHNRLTVAANYYNKYTSNLLVQAQAAATTGFSTYYTNDGEIRNRGFELSISSINIDQSNFRWTTNFNASRNFNKIMKLATPINNFDAGRNLLIDKQGYAVYSYWLYKQLYVDPETGAAIFQHADGTTGSAYTTSTSTDNRAIFDIAPKLFGGLTNDFTYKGFDLNVFFTYELGNKIWNHNRMLGETGGTLGPSGRVLLASQLDRWTTPGQQTDVPKLNAENYSIQQNSRFLEDGSFLRLRSVALSYNLPSSLVTKWNLHGVRLSATANNLFILTGYSGADPETSDQKGNNNIQGYDYAIPPMPRSFQFGLNIIF